MLGLALLFAGGVPGDRLEFVPHALSQSAIDCAHKPAVRDYMTATLPRAFQSSWARLGHTGESTYFSAKVRFTLDAHAMPTQIELDGAQPLEAGDDVVAAFRAVGSFPPFPAGAECIASQPFGLEVERDALEAARASHVDANVPDRADFDRLLQRDLAAYFVREPAQGRRLEYELLRDGSTQSGTALPKFYAWVRVSGGGAPVEEGAVRVAAVERTHFEVTQFVPADRIRADPDAIYRVFPAPVCARILLKLKATHPTP
jgi:hypothetical protein